MRPIRVKYDGGLKQPVTALVVGVIAAEKLKLPLTRVERNLYTGYNYICTARETTFIPDHNSFGNSLMKEHGAQHTYFLISVLTYTESVREAL